MTKHISHKKLIQIALQGPGAVEKNRHLKSCASCRKKAEEYLRLLSVSPGEIPAPSPHVEERILAHARKTPVQTTAPVQHPAPAFLSWQAGIVAATILIGVTGFFLFKTGAPVHKTLTIIPHNGTFTVNGIPQRKTITVKETEKAISIKGRARIEKKNHFSLIMSEKSELHITMGKQKKPVSAIISLSSGEILAHVIARAKTDKQRYLFRTPHAELRITGTRFRLRSHKATFIDLRDGSLTITALSSGERTILSAGQRCMISSRGEISHPGSEKKHLLEKTKDTPDTSSLENKQKKTIKKLRRESDMKDEMRNERRQMQRDMRSEHRRMQREKRRLHGH